MTTLTLEHTLLTPTTPFTRIETTTETATTTYLSNTFLATLEQSSTISSEQSQSEVFVSEALEVKEKRTNQVFKLFLKWDLSNRIQVHKLNELIV